MKNKDIEFNADDLVSSVESLAAHVLGQKKITLRSKTLELPQRIESLSPAQVRLIREKMNVSQTVFAAIMNIPEVTAASWERGRRKPTGAALRLLEIASRHPEILMAS